MKKRFSFRFILLILFLSFLVSCTTGEKISRIQPGMSKENVIKILGKPDGYQQRGEYEAFKYTNKLISGWSWDRADYHVVFKNEKVTEYGSGEVRIKEGPDMIILVPVR